VETGRGGGGGGVGDEVAAEVKFRRPADGVGGDKAGYWAARVCGGAAIERFHGVQ
jgi:hypothetical protein